jgi:hypothetical protein
VKVTHEREGATFKDGVVESHHQQVEERTAGDPPPAFVPFGVLHGGRLLSAT